MPSKSQTRALVNALWERGIRNPFVLYKRWNVPYATAYKYVGRLFRGESLEDRPRSGRPKKNTPSLRRRLGQIKANNPAEDISFYARTLSRRGGVKVGKTTVRRALHDIGYSWRLRPRRKLTSSQKRERIAFAQAHLHKSWERFWFFDESTFKLYRHGKRYWVRATTDESFSEPKPTESQEKVSITIAVAICHGGKSALAFLPKSFTAADLVEAWDRVLYPSLRWDSRGSKANTLVLDNDGRHHTQLFKAFLERKKISALRPWPSNSPDFNNIENAFARLKARVEELEPSNEIELRQAIQTAWNELTIELTEVLVESMPRRLAQCLELQGGRTKY